MKDSSMIRGKKRQSKTIGQTIKNLKVNRVSLNLIQDTMIENYGDI